MDHQQQLAVTYLDLDSGNSIVKVERDEEEEEEHISCDGDDRMNFSNENDLFPGSYNVLPEGNDDQEEDVLSSNSNLELESSPLSPEKPKKRGRKKKANASTPTVCKNSATSQSEDSSILMSTVKQIATPKFKNKEEFTLAMESNITNIVNECISELQMDPREYHPFYLRVYKFTTIGKQLGYISSESEVDSLWQQYDNFAKCQFEKWEGDGQHLEFNGEHSPYLTYILTKKVIFQGKAVIRLKDSKQQIKQRMKEHSTADSTARKFRRDWAAAGITDAEVRENLKYRLAYFEHVKHFTYPGDVTKVNSNWKGLLNDFPSNEMKDGQEEKSESQPSPLKRSSRERKPPTRLEPETGSCRKRKVNIKEESTEKVVASKKKTKLSVVNDIVKPKISGGIEGGTCTHCGKVMKTQLARHVREVHYKIYPASYKKISELKMNLEKGGDTSIITEEISNTKMGGECPHCHKMIKRQLQYHILKVHGEDSEQLSESSTQEANQEAEQMIAAVKGGKAIDGGECPHCGKVLAYQLQRHIKEVHLKIRPANQVKISELKKLYEEQKKEEDEAEEKDKSAQKKISAGGKCPHCNKILKRYLQYHIWRTHVTVEGKTINRPMKQDLKHLTAKQKREHWKEWQRLRRLNRTEEERQEESRKLRERYYKKINSMSPEELEEFRKKNRFQAFQKRVEQQFLPEEDRERLKTIKFLSRQAWLARKDDDWKEARKQQVKERVQAKRAVMTAKEREEERRRNKEWRQKLSGEKLAKYRESVRKSMKKYFDKLRRDNPEEYFNKVNNRENKLKWSGFLNYQRERTAKETPEQREARLLRYRINQAKRKARQELEREGASQEEIEKRLNEVEEQLRSQPKPAISSTYKPRPGARKPHKVPNPEIIKKEVKIFTEQKHPVHPQQQTTPSQPHVVVEARVEGSAQEHPQQINLLAVITPHHHQESTSQQQQVLYVPFHQVSMPVVSSTSLEFNGSTSLTLVQCSAAEPGATSTTTTATTFSIVSAHPVNPTQISAHFVDDGDYENGPPSCGDEGYDGGGNVNNGANSTFCHFPPSTEQTTVICVMEPALTPSATETISVTSIPPPLPQPQVLADELVNASPAILQPDTASDSKSKPLLKLETSIKLETTSKQAAMCDECGKTFTTQSSVQLHKNVVHAASNLVCPKCNLTLSSTISLWNHFTTYHLEDVDTFPEELYPNSKTFPPTPRQPRTEPYKQIRSDPNNPHSCPQCSKTFRQKCTRDDHIRRQHEGKGHFCDVCGKDQQSPAKLWRHKVERHGMKDFPPPPGVPAVTCKYCSEIIMRGYEQHVKKRHPDDLDDFNSWYVPEKGTAPRRNLDEKVQCPHCPSTVKHKLLNRHIKNMHTSLPKHSCPECGLEFKRIDHLKKHYRDQHVVADIEKKLEAKKLIKVTTFRNFTATCLLCQTEIVSKVLLRAHFVQDHHEIFQECQLASLPIFECSTCNEKFHKETQLKSHMQTNHPDKLFTCQHCGIFKYSQAELSAHERMHRKTERDRMRKQGLCAICDFDAKLTLPEDVNQNEENKVTLANNLENILREHVATLHSERYFPCPNPNCEKFTVNKDDFQHHMARCQKNGIMNSKDFVKRTVNKLMIFCPECRKPFKFYQFNKHLQGSHKIKIENEEIPCELCKPRVFKCRRFYVAHMHLVHHIPFDQLIDLAPDSAENSRSPKHKTVKRKSSFEQLGQKSKRGPKKRNQIKMEVTSDDNDGNFPENKVTEQPQQKRRKIGPKSKTQRGNLNHVENNCKQLIKGTESEKNGTDAICLDDLEKNRKLFIRVEKMSDDLFKYYLARRVFIKDEPEY